MSRFPKGKFEGLNLMDGLGGGFGKTPSCSLMQLGAMVHAYTGMPTFVFMTAQTCSQRLYITMLNASPAIHVNIHSRA